ncbi:hypothetical protein KKI95_18195 [Xenorhabdus bovienii]|uniref:hypothetical protein n=1 Tax=Xenorhabdus bovienii TaxID=40576 RepID=UPI0023B29D08|nr:hypothetical protein [Xenorhabdus bovienii]MDE9437810.1 hypothetical protein [Xenorhabdus bovienii]
MWDFGFGIMSISFMAFFPLLYICLRVIRSASAWVERDEGPKDRVVPKILIMALLGLLLGCFAQPKWEILKFCYDTNQKVGQCLFRSL